MKKAVIIFSFIFFVFTFSAVGQKDGEKPLLLDQILEKDAKKNLNVAWQYYKLKKAYKAVLSRTEETLAAHPTFSKVDEVLYLTGMSSYYLSIGKGKQKLTPATMTEREKERFSPKRLREDAIAFLGTLVEEHPKSKYRKKAQKILKKINPS